MMLTVQSIPDLQRSPVQDNSANHQDIVRYIDDVEEDKAIPYHARLDSRPFSYGVNAAMIAETKGLSSPSLVRKASFNKSSGDTLKKVQTQVYPDFSSKEYSKTYNNNNYKDLYNGHHKTTTLGRDGYGNKEYHREYHTINRDAKDMIHRNGKDPIDDLFTPSALRANGGDYATRREFREEYYKDEVKRYEPLKRSLTESTIKRRSPERIEYYKSSASALTSPYSESESLSPPGAFRNTTKSPEFHER